MHDRVIQLRMGLPECFPSVTACALLDYGPGVRRRHHVGRWSDDDRKPHVQQRSPGVIFHLGVLELSAGPCNAFANCGKVF